MNIRKAKKIIKKVPSGPIWINHIKYWQMDSVKYNNDYRTISQFFYDVGISELSNRAKISKEKLRKLTIFI
jgi:hypothetical protein